MSKISSHLRFHGSKKELRARTVVAKVAIGLVVMSLSFAGCTSPQTQQPRPATVKSQPTSTKVKTPAKREVRQPSETFKKEYLRNLKSIKVVVAEPFECAEALRQKNGKFWTPLVSPENKKKYKQRLLDTIAEVVCSAGYSQGDPSARLMVLYQDQKQSGLSAVAYKGYKAFKCYSMTLRLLDKRGQTIRSETYQEQVETTEVNVPFSFDPVVTSVREKATEFIRSIAAK